MLTLVYFTLKYNIYELKSGIKFRINSFDVIEKDFDDLNIYLENISYFQKYYYINEIKVELEKDMEKYSFIAMKVLNKGVKKIGKDTLSDDYTKVKYTKNRFIFAFSNRLFLKDKELLFIDLLLRNKETNKIMKVKTKLLISYKSQENNRQIISSEIIFEKYITNRFFSSFSFEENKKIKYLDYNKLLLNYYYIDRNDLFSKSKNKLLGDKLNSCLSREEKRYVKEKKILSFIGDYGTGKTMFLTKMCVYNGKTPVVVSVWSDVFTKDIVYYLYEKCRKEEKLINKIHIPKYIKSKLLFASAIYSVLLAFFSLLINSNIFEISTDKFFLFLGIMFVLAIIIALLFFSTFLISRNSIPHYYRDYFIEEISRIIRDNNLILILDDIDRNKREDIEELFSVLDSLNRKSNDINDYIGFMSFSNNHLQERFKEKGGRQEIAYLKDKVFVDKSLDISEIYDNVKIKVDLINMIVNMINKYEEINLPLLCLDNPNLKTINFRQIDDFKLELLNSKEGKEYIYYKFVDKYGLMTKKIL